VLLGETNADESTLDAELKALKAIDHDRIGTLALKSKLKKDKFLSSDPSIQSEFSRIFASDAVPASEGMAAKLESRLLSSKTVSKEVTLVISSLHSTLNPSGDEEYSDDEASDFLREPQIVDPPTVSNQRGTPEAPEDNCSDSEISSGPSQTNTSTPPPRSHAALGRTSHSPPHSHDAPRTLTTDSVFLPTLSNGFIPGGSDTDWSDGEARVADGPRKNRRGQRARRAIWEKKYGKGAKHLQKRDESGTTHSVLTSRNHFRGPQASPRPRLPGSSKQNSRAEKAEDRSKKHTSHQRQSGAVDDRPLHPSWVAKMRMKEQSSAVILPSQGKRIKFDD